MNWTRIAIFSLIVGIIAIIPLGVLWTINRAEAANEPEQSIYSEDEATFVPFEGGLARTEYTPDSYEPPKYDPFNNKFGDYYEFREELPKVFEDKNSPPSARINAYTGNSGIADRDSGTTETEFRFSAQGSSDHETQSNRLKVRWDFDGDGEFDTFFSRTKTVRHIFAEPGVFTVVMEVLDEGGLSARETHKVTIVENTEPTSFFTFKPGTGTTGQIFTFDTGDSQDSQYRDSALEYRFDWNGDGQFDTPANSKTTWRHRFDEPGVYRVVMEVADPEGAASYSEVFIEVTENIPPEASFVIQSSEVSASGGKNRTKFFFDASGSADVENPKKLRYRWDFNYTGKNDINFTTGWNITPKYNGFYDIPGVKIVRLQVMDEDGAIDEAFQTVEVFP